NTLKHIADCMDGLSLPNLESMGLGNLCQIKGVEQTSNSKAHFTKMKEASNGKDTMTGHWEIMGLKIEHPFQTFSEGFPKPLIEQLEKRTGRRIIGNKPASGTVIIEELGKEH